VSKLQISPYIIWAIICLFTHFVKNKFLQEDSGSDGAHVSNGSDCERSIMPGVKTLILENHSGSSGLSSQPYRCYVAMASNTCTSVESQVYLYI
jgi:hypothetical protein